jgi:alpha-tubulin suppressor-like RCC1 family protein
MRLLLRTPLRPRTPNKQSKVPVVLKGVAGVTSVALGQSSGCVLKTNGAVASWGSNNYGQLGDGTKTARLTAVTVKGLLAVCGG